jgi:hypothetical protein
LPGCVANARDLPRIRTIVRGAYAHYVETGRRSEDGFGRVFFRKDVADHREPRP